MSRLFVSLYRFFSSHKAVFWIVLIASTLVFSYFATKVHFEENIATLLPKTDKSKDCSVAFGNIKVKDKIFVEIESADPNLSRKDLAAKMDAFLEFLDEKDENDYIAGAFSKIDSDDLMNVIYYATGALPCHLGPDFYEAIDTLLNETAIEKIAGGEGRPELPSTGNFLLIDDHIFSPDSALVLAFLSPGFNPLDTKIGNKVETMLSHIVDEFQEENPDCTILYHGAVSNGTYNSRQIKKDLVWTVGISLILICLLICIGFKSKSTLLHLLLPVCYGSVFSLACVYWIKGSMSFIALGIGAIVLGVALSYCLHVLTHRKFVSSIEQVVAEQARPVFLGCLTTIGAFAGLLFTSSELLQDFGIFASFALIGTTFFALAFLPQFFTDGESEKNVKMFDIVNKINSYPLDRNKSVVIALVAVCAVCIFTSRNVKFDSDLNHIGYFEPKIMRSEQVYNQHVNGQLKNVYYAAVADNLDSAITFSRHLSTVLDSIKTAGLIKSYSGTDGILVPEAEQFENIALWKACWTPSRIKRTYDMLCRLDERHGWSEAASMDIPGTFKMMAEADYEPQSLYDAGVLPDALLSNFVEQNDNGWMVFSSVMLEKEQLKGVNNIVGAQPHIVVLDPFFYTGDMVEIVHNDFNTALWISSLFVFVVLLLSFRSLVISIIAFLPMTLSWYVTQGLMAIFGIDFNLINIMISTFIFGIGVDYSIFVMEGLLNRAKFQSYRLLVCHKAAIFFSAVTLIVFTASMLFAHHPAIHSIGLSTLIGMSATILITYALEPLLFKLAMRSDKLRKRALHEK